MFAFLRTLLLLSRPFICIAASLDDSANAFDVPGPAGPGQTYDQNLKWAIGSLQEIKFNTDINRWNMSLMQQNLTVNAATIVTNITSGSQVGPVLFNWTVDNHGADLSASSVFFFWINKGGPEDFTSHYSNMTPVTVTITAASNPSTTPALSASSAAASASAMTTTVASSASTTNLSSDTGTKIGLGVGLGLGIPILLAIVGFFCWRTVTNNRRFRAVQNPMVLQHSQDGADYRQKGAPLVQATEGPSYRYALSELHATPARPRPIELPADH